MLDRLKERLRPLMARERLLIALVGFAITAFFAVVYVSNPRAIQMLDFKIYDQLLLTSIEHHTESSDSPPTSGQVVIVDIDEESLKAFGQWPWPRYRFGLLLQNLRKAGAAGILLDIFLAERDRTSPEVMEQQYKRDLGLDITFQGLPDALRDNDAILAKIVKDSPSTFAFFFDFQQTPPQEQADCGVTPLSVAMVKEPGAGPPQDYVLNATQMICPIPELSANAPRMGFFNTITDADGVIRRVPLLMAYRDQLYPSLALATLLNATGTRSVITKTTVGGMESIRFRNVTIPTDKTGRLLLNYRGPALTFPYISTKQILTGDFDIADIRGKIVLVGTSASGLRDLRTTLYGAGYPGVEIQATAIDNIITGDFIARPDWAMGLEFSLLVFSGVLATLLITYTSAAISLVPLIILTIAYWLGAQYSFTEWRLYLSPLFPYMVLGTAFTFLTFLKFFREERQRAFLHSAFSQYVAPTVVKQIVQSPEKLSLEGEEKEVTILFSDVRSFTSLSEKLTPTQVVELLRDYLTPMTRIITGNGGTLDKFIGDAVMAFWNAPVDIEHHQKMALATALAMQQGLEELNVGFAEKFGFTIAVGVGIHAGTVRVGNMGSADLFDYTLIGDNVNLASRLEGLTKYYGQKLVISGAIKDACADDPDFSFRQLDRVMVKGKNEPVDIYTAYTRDEGNARADEIARWHKLLEPYREGRFKQARAGFMQMAEDYPDEKLYLMYAKRCEQLLTAAPDEWDGVYRFTTK